MKTNADVTTVLSEGAAALATERKAKNDALLAANAKLIDKDATIAAQAATILDLRAQLGAASSGVSDASFDAVKAFVETVKTPPVAASGAAASILIS